MSTASNRHAQADGTRASLLAAARELFGSRGYADTSVQAIVNAAEVTKGAVYHHFDAKQEIFSCVFEAVQRDIGRTAFVVHLGADEAGDRRTVVRNLSAESNDQVWAHLLDGCRTYLELHTDPAVQRIVLIDGPAQLPWSQRHQIQREHSTVLLRADLRRAARRRMIRTLPLQMLATMLAGALNEACVTVTGSHDHSTAVNEAMDTIECFLEGVRRPDDISDRP